MALKKPSELFNKNVNEGQLTEELVDTSFREELLKVESLSSQIAQLQQDLTQKVVKTDLEETVLSQISEMKENFRYLQDNLIRSNQKDIISIKEVAQSISNSFNNLVEIEIPKYKKQLNNNQIRIGEKFDSFKQIVDQDISNIRDDLDVKIENIAEVIDNNLEYFNNQLQETSLEARKTASIYHKLSTVFENKLLEENEKLEEYSNIIESLRTEFLELQSSIDEQNQIHSQFIEEQFEAISFKLNEHIDKFDTNTKIFNEKIVSNLSNIKADVVINEKHIKKVEKFLQNNHQELIELKEEVFGEIQKLPYGDIQENVERLNKKIQHIENVYKNIQPEVIVKEVIQEGLLNDSPETKNVDSLTPLDQNFVTLEQLQQHYRLFLNRIQQQLITLGGGGETRLKYLDDIVGIATNSNAYNGKFLQWNSITNKAEFVTVTQGMGTATTGYYGSFYDTSTQYPVGVASTTIVKLNTTAASNGFSIQNGTRIVAEHSGVYNTQFSFQLDQNSGSTGHIWIWLSKNGVDIPESNSVVAIQGSNAEVVPSWNYIVDMNVGDYIEYKWITDDDKVGIISSSISTIKSKSVNIPNVPSAIVTIQQITGVIAGTGSTSTQTLNQTLGYGNTSSLGMSVGVVTALSFVKYDGTSNQFLKADGSVDNSSYATQTYVGLATAGLLSFSGNGSSLTGIVTYIEAGSGISVDQSTGKVIITNIGGNGGGIVGLTIQDENSTVGTAGSVATLNFVGQNITATSSGTISTITVSSQTYVQSSGYATTAGIATYSTSAGYAITSGISTVSQGLTGTPNINVGVVTATSYNGSGSSLSGIVTSISSANNNIIVNQSTGNVIITGIGVTAGANTVYTGINTFTGTNTFTGNLLIEQASESFNKYSTSISSGATVNLDCSTGNIHYITSSVSGNWIANLTNVGVSSGFCANYTLVINQGTTAYIPSTLQIAGVSTSINWQGGSIPSGNNSKKDVIAFTVLNDGGSYIVFGQLVTFG